MQVYLGKPFLVVESNDINQNILSNRILLFVLRNWKLEVHGLYVGLGIVTLFISLKHVIFTFADLINLSFGSISVVVRICDTHTSYCAGRGCLNCGSRPISSLSLGLELADCMISLFVSSEIFKVVSDYWGSKNKVSIWKSPPTFTMPAMLYKDLFSNCK